MGALFRLFAPLMALALPAAALGAPGNQSTIRGNAGGQLVAPSGIDAASDLRFGAVFSPTTNGTVTVAPNGAITTTGGVNGNVSLIQPPDGRGPATFNIVGDPRRLFLLFLPGPFPITNGANTMQVDTVTSNAAFNRVGRFDRTGVYILDVGGTLRVNANQAVGQYSGEFEVTVFFL